MDKLYSTIDNSLKKSLAKEMHYKVMGKIDKIIGLIYGSITGLLVGSATQSLGRYSAPDAYMIKYPFTEIEYNQAIKEPILGQLLLHITEFKNAKWDSEKYVEMKNYLSVIQNQPILKIEPHETMLEMLKTGKSSELYNLSSEDFYTRIPMIALFGDTSLQTLICKIMHTHTSYEASAYGLIVVSIIQHSLRSESYVTNDLIKEKIIPMLEKYHMIMLSNQKDSTSEAEKLRVVSERRNMVSSFDKIIKQINNIMELYDDFVDIKENTDHLNEEQVEEYKITSIYDRTLDRLNLFDRNNSHPALIALWLIETLKEIERRIGISTLNIGFLIKTILKSIAIRTGCSGYNTMVAGAILGSIFSCTEIEELIEMLDKELIKNVNENILAIICNM